MTMPAYAEELGRRLPDDADRATANQLRTIIASHLAGDADLRVSLGAAKPVDITLTRGLAELLIDMLRLIGKGDAVTLVPVSQMLTTQQAADILNVSRPYFITLIDKGAIKCSLVGRHRRIKAEDLFEYKKQRDAARAKALSDLAERDAEII